MNPPASGDSEDTLIRKICDNLGEAFSVSISSPPANEQADERAVLYKKWLETVNLIP